MRKSALAVVAALLVSPALSMGAVMLSMSPLTTFGGGDGWLAPGEGGYTFLGTANNERGIAFGNGHVYLLRRTGGNNIRVLDKNTGADVGSLATTGISGGTFAVSQIATGSDGQIYVANL